MKREIGAVLALSAALTMSGCETIDSASVGPNMVDATTTFVPPPTPDMPVVNLSGLPAELPAAVVTQENNAVTVMFSYKMQNPNATGNVMTNTGSGVRIAGNNYLTAGHIFRQSNGGLSEGANICDSIDVQTSDQVKGSSSYGSILDASREVSSFVGDDSGSTPDIALLAAGTVATAKPNTDPIVINNETTRLGMPLFFVNYEPTANQSYRTPSKSSLQEWDGQNANIKLSKPAIYGGFVVKILSNGDYEVAEDLKSYGATTDARTRQGASGGMVETADGKLAGIVIKAADALIKVSELSSDINTTLTGISPDTTVAFSIVQPVTNKLVSELGTKLMAAPQCLPPIH